MVLEALAAVGLASAVVQFVQFTSEVASKGRDYYKSADGAIHEHVELGSFVDSFSRLSLGLETAKSRIPSSSTLTGEERSLIDAAAKAEGVCCEIKSTLDGLIIFDKKTKLHSFRKALKAVWNESKIEADLRRLQFVREELVLNLLVVINNKQIHAEEITRLQNETLQKDILEAIRNSKLELSNSLRDFTATLSTAVGRQDDPLVENPVLSSQKLGISSVTDPTIETGEPSYHAAANQAVLDSLYFGQMDDRHDSITEAYAGTFQWIFDAQPPERKPWASFSEWLKTERLGKLYWITGKPGSGKSTLMRFLLGHERTESDLTLWAMPQRIILASCFVWHSGDIIQRSKEGLLRTLLFQIISQVPHMAKDICPWRWRTYVAGAPKLTNWTLPQLQKALLSALKLLSGSAKICFFIDGLDEFEGDENAHSDLVAMIKKYSEFEHVKICVSSRPWVIFKCTFEVTPSLELHKLTEPDISRYVNRELLNSPEYIASKKTQSFGDSKLADKIIAKAQGVFLWVTLVVKDLLKCLRNRDSMQDLLQKLDSIPADLHEYFKSMFNRLDDSYIEQACLCLRVAMVSEVPQYLLTYSFIFEDGNYDPVTMEVRKTSQEELQRRYEDCEWKLNSRCRGLLEVVATANDYDYVHLTRKVRFVHKTVKDFLHDGGVQSIEQIISTRSKGARPSDADEALARSLLAQIKMLDPGSFRGRLPLSVNLSGYVQTLIQELFSAARRYETNFGSPLMRIVDSLDHTLAELHRVGPPEFMNAFWISTFPQVIFYDPIFTKVSDVYPHVYGAEIFLLLVLDRRLFQYFKARIEEDRAFVTQDSLQLCVSFLLRVTEISYLLTAIPIEPDTRILEFLLRSGADPNQPRRSRSITLWAHYLHYIHELKEPRLSNLVSKPIAKARACSSDMPHKSIHLQCVRLMVAYGAEPWIECPDTFFEISTGGGNGTAKMDPQEIPHPQREGRKLVNVLTIIEYFFGRAFAAELLPLFGSNGHAPVLEELPGAVSGEIPQILEI